MRSKKGLKRGNWNVSVEGRDARIQSTHADLAPFRDLAKEDRVISVFRHVPMMRSTSFGILMRHTRGLILIFRPR